MFSLLIRLLIDDEGQDLVEYVLLTTVIGIVGVVAVNAIGLAINTAYTSWDSATQDLWEPQPPAGS